MLLTQLYRYHAWANDDLLATLQTLERDRPALDLDPVRRLVNHVLVISRIFAAHLTGTSHGYASDNTEVTPDIGKLRAGMAAVDGWYLEYLDTLAAADLDETLRFVFTDGAQGMMARREMLLHVALHAAYHRGEAGMQLKQLSASPPWDTFAVHVHQREPGRRAGIAPVKPRVSAACA
jgi:uncharacterized damage-inducible protein DinB